MRPMTPLFVPLTLLLRPPPFLFQRLFNLLLLLLYQEHLHRVVVIMIHHQLLQLHLLPQHLPRPLLFLFFRLPTLVSFTSSLPPHDILPPNLPLLRILVVPLLISCMINPYQPATDLRSAQVIDSQVRAALVFVLEPPETFALAGLLVAHELEEDGLAELGEYGYHVAFGEFVGEAAEVDVGRVAVVDVPGCVGRTGRKLVAGLKEETEEEMILTSRLLSRAC